MIAPLLLDAAHPFMTGEATGQPLPWYWLALGFAAQAAFTARFLVQWIASERAKRTVIPRVFWILSLVGGCGLLLYFLRRRDPVGIVGQLFGVVVYSRNLALMTRVRPEPAARAGALPS